MHGHEEQGFLRKYVFSYDHKVIGIQYLVTAIVMAIVAGALAVIIRTRLAWPGVASKEFPPEAYISFVTMHGTLMVFFVVSLALSGFANFLIPLQIGARDVAFPRLVRGENSGYVRDADQPYIKRLFPRSSVVTIEGAGHWVHAEAPERFLEVVGGFLSRRVGSDKDTRLWRKS